MSISTWTIGNAKISAILETTLPFEFETCFQNFDPQLLQEHQAWLQPYFDNNDGTFNLAIQAFVIESNGITIMVDTCIGTSPLPEAMPFEIDPTTFMAQLAEIGYQPKDIDYVLCTHLHFDHVGWNTTSINGAIEPTFPNARYLLNKKEYHHWKSDSDNDLVSNFHHSIAPLFDADLVNLVDANHVLNEEVKLIESPGHSPGHVSVFIESNGQKAFIGGDCAHHPIQWTQTNWAFFSDSDARQSTQTRKSLLPTLLDQPILVLSTHSPIAGYLVSQQDKIQFQTL